MKKIILLLCLTLIISCEKEPVYNNFDEIIHYQITNKDAYKVDSINEFLGILGLNGNHTIRFSKIESELSGYGFKKINIIDGKVKSIDSIITNNLIYETNLIACSPIYRDILILKKKKQIVGVLKLCFECNIAESYMPF